MDVPLSQSIKNGRVFENKHEAGSSCKKLIDLLFLHFPKSKINFDLKDCDKILRIDGQNIFSADVINVLKSKGFICEELE